MGKLPTVKIYKGEGFKIVNEDNLSDWQEKGWSTEKDAPAPFNFSQYNKTDLTYFAEQADIEGCESMTKAKLVAALEKSGYIPEEG